MNESEEYKSFKCGMIDPVNANLTLELVLLIGGFILTAAAIIAGLGFFFYGIIKLIYWIAI
jgi:hypothetical protein